VGTKMTLVDVIKKVVLIAISLKAIKLIKGLL